MKHTPVESYGYVYGYALSEVQAQQKFRTAQFDVFSHQEKEIIEIYYKRDKKWQDIGT